MLWLLSTLLIGLALACSPLAESNQADADDLLGHTFVASRSGLAAAPDGLASAQSVEVHFVPADKARQGRFASDIGWNADCNRMGGTLEFDGDVLIVKYGGTTEMACTGLEAAQDETLTAFFDADPTWQLDDDTLTLTGDGGRLTLERQTAVSN